MPYKPFVCQASEVCKFKFNIENSLITQALL